ncbi:hypothetical protein ACG2F4_08045 [Halalkalibaculum sp. DA3122]|uniref:hypothetical protein n=1 Tax=Halalkalibaculum sp. DA3122 TaxID=3373607 RepID=UPI003754633F
MLNKDQLQLIKWTIRTPDKLEVRNEKEAFILNPLILYKIKNEYRLFGISNENSEDSYSEALYLKDLDSYNFRKIESPDSFFSSKTYHLADFKYLDNPSLEVLCSVDEYTFLIKKIYLLRLLKIITSKSFDYLKSRVGRNINYYKNITGFKAKDVNSIVLMTDNFDIFVKINREGDLLAESSIKGNTIVRKLEKAEDFISFLSVLPWFKNKYVIFNNIGKPKKRWNLIKASKHVVKHLSKFENIYYEEDSIGISYSSPSFNQSANLKLHENKIHLILYLSDHQMINDFFRNGKGISNYLREEAEIPKPDYSKLFGEG